MHLSAYSRRAFLECVGKATPALVVGAGLVAGCAAGRKKRRQEELACDVVIAGGGLGGCAAAVAACRRGLRVVMTEPTDWVGGQLTSQGVPPDENPWVETFGATRSYQELRSRIREHYRRNFPLKEESRANKLLNPGNGWVSLLCHEPRAALNSLEGMLEPWISNGQLRVLRDTDLVDCEVHGDRIRAVRVWMRATGESLVLRGAWFIDATETGDLLPLAKAEHVNGAEGRRETGEPHAPEIAAPENHQAFTVCFAMDYLAGEDHTVERPEQYSYWRDYIPRLAPPWPGRLLSWEYSDPVTLRPKSLPANPEARSGLWAYRRIADRDLFMPGTYRSDISLVNWPMNDYMDGNLYGVCAREAARHVHSAKQLSASLLHWMQTEAPRPDGGLGWKGLRLRKDLFGTEDGFAKGPYVRESRRLKAEFTVSEQHVSADLRAKELGVPVKEARAVVFPDSVGIGYYRIDLHPTSGGDNYLDIGSLPFQIPLSALVPCRLENLLPGCKNLGVTHITNGCYRLHPVEWNVGEAAGLLAAFCTGKNTEPRSVLHKTSTLGEFQELLRSEGIPLEWPKDLRI